MGKLIVLEGNDGAGKGTQLKLITSYLISNGYTVKHLHFPMYNDNPFGKAISKFLKGDFGTIDEVDSKFIAAIYAMDRFEYSERLEEDLLNNDYVILDRYVFSNVAYQCAKVSEQERDYLKKWILEFEFFRLDLPEADLTIYLDVPIETIDSRLNSERVGDDRTYLDGKADIHEKDISFQDKVRNVYLDFEGYEGFMVVKTYDEQMRILTPDEIFELYNDKLI